MAKSFGLVQKAGNTTSQPLELHHLAHDLRSPLNAILGFAELLLEGIEGPLNDTQTEDIKAIYQSAKTLQNLINSVVDLSKLEAGQLGLSSGPVRLKLMLETILATQAERYQLNPVKLTANLPASLPALHGDSARIEQMLLHLIEFARTIQQVTRLELAVVAKDQTVTFNLAAVGGRLPAETLETMFDLVVNIDDTGRSTLGPGGLKLPLVRYLAEAHHGQVWAQLQDGVGPNFYLSLPVEQPVEY